MTFWSWFERMAHVASRAVGVAGRGRAGAAGVDAGVVDFGGLGAAGPDPVVGRAGAQQHGDRPAGGGESADGQVVARALQRWRCRCARGSAPVSYTHLT